MPHSYVCCHLHCVFSTKGRQDLIPPEIRPRLWAYIGGIAQQNGCAALQIGGTGNHSHALLGLPAKITIAKAVQLIKGGSSKWLSDTFPAAPGALPFEWQEGYGAFSIGVGDVDKTIRYIINQEERHKRVSFEDEFRAFLARHGQKENEHTWG